MGDPRLGSQPMESVAVVVVGAGQAGLAMSHELSGMGIDHVVLERNRIAQSWRERWDSFSLVLPNWTLELPGHSYRGPEPDGFMPRDDLVSFIADYAADFGAPVVEQAEVTGVEQREREWMVRTTAGDYRARALVVATGAFQKPFRPTGWDTLSDSILGLDVTGYSNPDSLPEGKVLVIGSGQTGCQIAADLVLAGREVFMACGRAPWLPRRAGGRDIFWWIWQSGFMEAPVTALEHPAERLGANPQLTGRDGGRDLHFRTLAQDGVNLLGHLRGFDDGTAHFAPDLPATIAFADQAHDSLRSLILATALDLGLTVDDLTESEPWTPEVRERLDLTGFSAVISASGFRPNYQTWLDFPEAFDPLGFPTQDMNGTGALPGLHFVGVHFLRKRKSALLAGVGEDAALVAHRIQEHLAG